MSTIHDYQVDHLLLLVGSNQIPNAVAGKLLVAKGGTITLIHSGGSFPLAQRLQSWLADPNKDRADIAFALVQVDESNADSVYRAVYEKLDAYEHAHRNAIKAGTARVGLNYTGGTKVMAVQAHRAVEEWAKTHQLEEPVFSYLDARTLRMRFDPATGREATSFYVGLEVDISIAELLLLHNWESINKPAEKPVLPQTAAALLTVHRNAEEARKWTGWLRNELFPVARKPVSLPPPFLVYQSGMLLQGQYDVKHWGLNSEWKASGQLHNQEIPWPDLPTLRETMSNELGQHGAEYLNLTAATGKGCKDEKEFCRWLSGIWLESAVLGALQQCPQELHLQECRMDIKPKVPGSSGGEQFQFDVAAIRGYQLFAFSCSTEGEGKGLKALLKQKLFEAYVRARQMGGDEACTALVCSATQETTEKLEAEMRRDLSPEGRIRVFGREHLENLAEHIANWVRQQSKEH